MVGDEKRLNQLPSELDLQFDVTGRFYLHCGSARTYECRDLLEIRRCHVDTSVQADAVLIMMNPGSSKPLDRVSAADHSESTLVRTKPDTTQYQLMRLMTVMGWERVKVLNLSDLRVSRSEDFFRKVSEFEEREGHDGHSLFAKTRRSELVSALRRDEGAPLVAAWGVDRKLQTVACTALEALGGVSILGLPHKNGQWAYRHPLPKTSVGQARWRVDALTMLRADAAAYQRRGLD